MDVTPRASQLANRAVDATPRPRIPAPDFGGSSTLSVAAPVGTVSGVLGFTISYLRRVPELADMARRVVKAEAKRRAREDRKKAKEAGVSGSSQSHVSRNGRSPQMSLRETVATAGTKSEEKIAPKVKRLFRWAIVQLVQEGSLVISDGPARRCPSIQMLPNMSGLWKSTASSCSSMGADSSVFSASSVSGTSQLREGAEDDDDVALSDPDENEESYLPLTPAYLGRYVEEAIAKLSAPPPYPSATKGKLPITHPRQADSRSSYSDAGGQRHPAWATKETILAWLRKDDRWRSVGEWNVEEALSLLSEEGRAWNVGKGRWELTL